MYIWIISKRETNLDPLKVIGIHDSSLEKFHLGEMSL